MNLNDADRLVAEIEAEEPGWQVWYVYHASSASNEPTWHATPRIHLEGETAGDIRAQIKQANGMIAGAAALPAQEDLPAAAAEPPLVIS